jgi:hypothetical protein
MEPNRGLGHSLAGVTKRDLPPRNGLPVPIPLVYYVRHLFDDQVGPITNRSVGREPGVESQPS